MKKGIAWLLIAALAFANLTSCASQQGGQQGETASLPDYNIYATPEGEEPGYISQYREMEASLLEDADLVFSPEEYMRSSESSEAVLLPEADSHGYGKSVLFIPPSSEVTVEIQLPQGGGYHIGLDYFIPENSLQNLALDITINGEIPFKEAHTLELPAVWMDEETGPRFDEYQNEIYPIPVRVFRWQNALLNLPLYQLETPLVFAMQEGANTITIRTNNVPVLLGDIQLKGRQVVASCNDYRQSLKGRPEGADFLTVEGEDYLEKSESYIRAARSRDVDFEPYDYARNLINSLDAATWKNASERVTYQFPVESGGVYYITLKYRQDDKTNMPVFKNIYVDGELLFDGLSQYSFSYAPQNVNHTLSNEGEPIGFYLEPGEHTLTLESTASPYFTTYETLLQIIEQMNQIGLEVRLITGNKSDLNRDWQIDKYLPDIRERLTNLADDIDLCYQVISQIAGLSQLTTISDLKSAFSQIRRYLEDLDYFVNNINHFSQGDGALTDYVANVLPLLLEQPMQIDRIYIHNSSAELPVPSKGFGVKLVEQAKILATSYMTSADTNLKTEKDKVNVWANMSVAHIEILRQQIATYYGTDQVNISAMPDESKLLLSVTSGTAPDAAIGVTLTRPFDFALRGAAYNLRNFDDFAEATQGFTDEMLVPFTMNEGIYGIPQNATFYVLFYRTDIMKALGLSIPETWDDVIEMVPTLYQYGMNFNTILAAGDAYKPFSATVPIIQQYGGSLYAPDGTSVAFGDPNTVKAFTFMTDLYTRYSLPVSIPNFYYNFKNGITPIGISEINTYNLLTNAAPEIYGQWDIAPSVGVRQEDGSICNVQPSISSGCLIMEQSNKKEETWEFLKWWMSAETQLTYSDLLRLTYGPEYLWNTANLDAIAQYTIFSDAHKEVILNQLENTMETPLVPAYYQVERDLSNARNEVIMSDFTAREALDRAILSSNRAIEKKMREFNFVDENGNILEPFQVANSEQIKEWRGES